MGREDFKTVDAPERLRDAMHDGAARELGVLLARFDAPPAPAALGARLLESYRGEISRRKEKVMSAYPNTSDAFAASNPFEYQLTILEEAGLTRRLLGEVRAVARDAELTWPEFKRDPAGFAVRMARAYAAMLGRGLARENVGYGIATAFAVVLALAAAIVVAGRLHRGQAGLLAQNVREDLEFQGMVTDIPEAQPTPDEGPAGTNKGQGGGSKPKFEKPAGGGGGGRNEVKPASFGKLPPASLDIPQVRAPDPHPPTIKNPSLPVPATIVADPVLFPPDPRNLAYGDPKSKATETSSGPGTGGGIGTGTGGGVGPGEGGGVGPGRGGNTGGGDFKVGGGGPGGGGGGGDYNRTFTAKEVTSKAVITARPEPLYTEEARKNNVTGTVVLKLVLGSNGSVSNIRVVKGLPDGLSEKAIAAARQIQFRPAQKDGRAVSQWLTIEYNFNIY